MKNVSYYDGALGDPVPVEKAFQLGCDQVVVILTKPEGELRTAEIDEKWLHESGKSIPKLRKSYVNGRKDTMKAFRRHRNMSGRAKHSSYHRTIPVVSAP